MEQGSIAILQDELRNSILNAYLAIIAVNQVIKASWLHPKGSAAWGEGANFAQDKLREAKPTGRRCLGRRRRTGPCATWTWYQPCDRCLNHSRPARGSCTRGRMAATSVATQCTLRGGKRLRRRASVASDPTISGTRSRASSSLPGRTPSISLGRWGITRPGLRSTPTGICWSPCPGVRWNGSTRSSFRRALPLHSICTCPALHKVQQHAVRHSPGKPANPWKIRKIAMPCNPV
jgi:hypothetical protein